MFIFMRAIRQDFNKRFGKRLKGRSARLVLDEFSELKKRYWGQHLWGMGQWSTRNTDEMIQGYWEHHRDGPNSDQNFILE